MSAISKPYFDKAPCNDSGGVALIESNLSILRQLVYKIREIGDKDLIDDTGNRNSTIGMHVRHIIEFYQALFQTIDNANNTLR